MINYPMLSLNDGNSEFHIKSFNMVIDSNGDINLLALCVDDPIDVFTDMRQYAPTNTRMGTFINSVEVFDEFNDKVFEDKRHYYTYNAVSVQFLSFNPDGDQTISGNAENRGLAQIELRLND